MTNAARIAVVTGGTAGIGLATARYLLQRGYRVAIFGQNEGHMENAKDFLAGEFGPDRIFARTVDLGQPAQITTFFRELEQGWGSVAVLVCNAGVSPKGADGPTPFSEVSLDEWNFVLSVNLTGAMLCCQAVLPGMVRHGFGRIVFIGSVAGRTLPRIAGSAYVASKAAIAGLARSLVWPYAAHGITVNVVAPGRIATAMAGASGNQINRAAITRIPAGRMGDPHEVAAVVGFLAGDEAAFVNGAILDVNGGEFAPA
ncbi:3-ketoacyl-ACP reductase [Sinorhizobium sp. A49]|uniref:SDR family oxidoreductase n=1 Tax=Sinorhizobium sp. A49 TaxID=1945861 RepID=UPI000987B61E|nr:SDR family oxidoreductase [Sinorhizobium sp. A49]OOG75107.1 3-ketoacyl-ACP reductase [Sinorhizobium sp. A49]